MDIEEKIFKRHIPDFKKIIEYGFVKNKEKYFFEKTFKDDEFKAVIEISKEGRVFGIVYDNENNDEYLPLRVESAQGEFVGLIREEYEKILKEIRQNCFKSNFFIYPQTNRITEEILKKYGDNPEFLWEKFSGYGVFRNPKNQKWYGLIGNIDYSKLDKTKKGEIEIINIKLDKEEIQELLQKEGFYPAWHMNKKSWITIILNETLSDNEIMKYIDESYSFTIAKTSKKILK